MREIQKMVKEKIRKFGVFIEEARSIGLMTTMSSAIGGMVGMISAPILGPVGPVLGAALGGYIGNFL